MRTAIITGASGNMGQAVVKKFLAAEYRVVSTIVPDDPSGIDIKGKDFETAIVDFRDEKLLSNLLNLLQPNMEVLR